MYRKPTPPNPELDALLERRDDLRIRIALLAERENSDAVELKMMSVELFEVESRIRTHERRRP